MEVLAPVSKNIRIMQSNMACITCAHFDGKTTTCKAFPEGIPDVIISGLDTHEKPLPFQKNSVIYKEDDSVPEELRR